MRRTVECRIGLVGTESTHHLQTTILAMCAVEEVTLLLSVLRGTRFLVLPSAKPLSDRRDVRLSSTLVPSPITLPSEKVYLLHLRKGRSHGKGLPAAVHMRCVNEWCRRTVRKDNDMQFASSLSLSSDSFATRKIWFETAISRER